MEATPNILTHLVLLEIIDKIVAIQSNTLQTFQPENSRDPTQFIFKKKKEQMLSYKEQEDNENVKKLD